MHTAHPTHGLENAPETSGLTVETVTPEHQIRFDEHGGEPRNADLTFAGRTANAIVAVTIEAKADEPFGATVTQTLTDALERRIEHGASRRCRAGAFAPRLQPGDTVVYLTVKGAYGADPCPGWRLVAVLNVVERFETHGLAAAWYRSKSLALPSNCMVEGHPPQPLELTNGHPPAEIRARFPIASEPERAIRLWDAGYRQRVAEWPVFLICNTCYLTCTRHPRSSSPTCWPSSTESPER